MESEELVLFSVLLLFLSVVFVSVFGEGRKGEDNFDN